MRREFMREVDDSGCGAVSASEESIFCRKCGGYLIEKTIKHQFDQFTGEEVVYYSKVCNECGYF